MKFEEQAEKLIAEMEKVTIYKINLRSGKRTKLPKTQRFFEIKTDNPEIWMQVLTPDNDYYPALNIEPVFDDGYLKPSIGEMSYWEDYYRIEFEYEEGMGKIAIPLRKQRLNELLMHL